MREGQPEQYGDRGEQVEQYGRRGEQQAPVQKGIKPDGKSTPGTSATSQTEDRQPPKGGSGTAPPKDQRK